MRLPFNMFPKQIIKFSKINRRGARLPNVVAQQIRSISDDIMPKPLKQGASIATSYKPKQVEERKWEEVANYLPPHPYKETTNETFRVILPPPNVTGDLHLGHVMTATIQDAICRYNWLNGKKPDWAPGLDHAGIATQVAVEKMLLKKRGVTRHELGKEAFLEEVWKWKEEKGDKIIEDLKRLGCAINWDRQYFTMDQDHSFAVNKAFIQLFDENLIERRKSLVNWSCALESAISDIEIENLEINEPTSIAVPGHESNVTFGKLWDIKYRICDSNQYVTVSTTRPETLLGDVAVAMHPDDPRYLELRESGQVYLWHPFREEPIPLIFDLSVDREFGTGAVKITPAHDKTDFDIAARHLLKPIPVFNNQGEVLDTFDALKDKPRFVAREILLNMLSDLNLLVGSKDHKMVLPLCTRSKDVVEFMLRDQWFLQTKEMAEAAASELRSGRLHMSPSDYEVEWLRWLDNCHDWCISRQLWWGHQIPAYFATDDNGKTCWVAAHNEREAERKANEKLGGEIVECKRDADVLDTWFSSSLVPLTAFGWPDGNYKENLPLSMMGTGHDILFFWVARMAMMGIKLTGEMPFNKILLNGILCDLYHRKMSKSLGNVITPQEVVYGVSEKDLKAGVEKNFKKGVIDETERKKSLKSIKRLCPEGIPACGTDALRFTLCNHNLKARFVNFNIDECHKNKLFLNKIWQATRFTLYAADKLNLQLSEVKSMDFCQQGIWTRWILSRLATTLLTCRQHFNDQNLHGATRALKDFLYKNVCDYYLETTKPHIRDEKATGLVEATALAAILSHSLKALYPFTPFISMELLSHLKCNIDFQIEQYHNPKLEAEMFDILDLIRNIRGIMSFRGISKKHEPDLYIFADSEATQDKLNPHLEELKTLTNVYSVTMKHKDDITSTVGGMDFSANAGYMCNIGIKVNEKYVETRSGAFKHDELNETKLAKLEKELERYKSYVNDEGFQMYANKDVQKKQYEKIRRLELEIEAMKTLAKN